MVTLYYMYFESRAETQNSSTGIVQRKTMPGTVNTKDQLPGFLRTTTPHEIISHAFSHIPVFPAYFRELFYILGTNNGKALLDTIHELRGKVIISVIQNHGDVLLIN
jgi:hypothetical protein